MFLGGLDFVGIGLDSNGLTSVACCGGGLQLCLGFGMRSPLLFVLRLELIALRLELGGEVAGERVM